MSDRRAPQPVPSRTKTWKATLLLAHRAWSRPRQALALRASAGARRAAEFHISLGQPSIGVSCAHRCEKLAEGTEHGRHICCLSADIYVVCQANSYRQVVTESPVKRTRKQQREGNYKHERCESMVSVASAQFGQVGRVREVCGSSPDCVVDISVRFPSRLFVAIPARCMQCVAGFWRANSAAFPPLRSRSALRRMGTLKPHLSIGLLKCRPYVSHQVFPPNPPAREFRQTVPFGCGFLRVTCKRCDSRCRRLVRCSGSLAQTAARTLPGPPIAVRRSHSACP